ncbi:MAG TPA: von Willebrand factor type A domain-containing protein [Longimicrobiales bacterium]|nr:von Willebrand factor type A domain-containing protein [Longimicrobiales bacterium]
MVRMLAIALLLVVASAPTSPRQVADIVITGRVTTAEGGSPVPGAVVALAGTSWAVLTDHYGEFRLLVPESVLPARDARLSIRANAFADTEVALPPARDGTVRVDVQLRQASFLDELMVVGYGAQRRAAPTAAAGVWSGAVNSYAPMPHADWNTEAYAYIEENGFRSPVTAPLSTFSIDVDRASYSNVRRFLLEGRLPPVDAVRIEEMVNYFGYDYPTSVGEHRFAVTTELGTAPWQPGHLLLRIGLASEPVPMDAIPPGNLVFLIDVSGSMDAPNKLPLVKQSLRMLVDQLRPVDRVAIVVYAGTAGVVLPSTPGNDRRRILDSIESLQAGGSTAGGAGLLLAYGIAAENHIPGGNNRVILATDGDFNVGASSESELVRLVSDHRRQGTFLTVLGFGTGNLQDSRMQAIAQHGNGNYAYIDGLLEARKVLVSELGGTLLTVAQDVKLQVEFNPAVVRAYRLIGYENRLLNPEDFSNDHVDAGEMGAGHVVTALYEIVPVGADSPADIGGVDPLRYQPSSPNPLPSAGTGEVAFVRARYKVPGEEESRLLELPVSSQSGATSEDFRFAAGVAGFGMLLRGSEHRGSTDVDMILDLARAGRGRDEDGLRAEFIRLVELYAAIATSRGGHYEGE